jgi:hypothetical protein
MKKVHGVKAYGIHDEGKIYFYLMPEKPRSRGKPPIGITDRYAYTLQMDRRIIKQAVHNNQNPVAPLGKAFHQFKVTSVSSGSDFIVEKNAEYIQEI